jgi:signal transduction histidine kinase/ActR/RegA family two-component response regulator
MVQVDPRLFDVAVWRPALEKYGGATHLTVSLYDASAQLMCGPVNPTALFELFARHGDDAGLFSRCVRRCVEGAQNGPIIVDADSSGVAVLCTPLFLGERIVGAAVAGYRLLEFPQSVAIERLALKTGLRFALLWDVIRRESPISRQRFLVQGELLHVLGDTILRERHRTRQYEETAKELKAAAAAKDEFLAVLSHELRTPLAPILGWARMLRLGDDPQRIHRAADVIERNTLLQTKLVDDLLELTRVSRGKVTLDLRTVYLGEAIHSSVDAYTEAARDRRVEVDIVEGREPLLVSADIDRLQQIFRNVLSNALKFTPAGGRVTVTLRGDADTALVKIRDSGEGIDPKFLPFVFDIFRQQEHGTRRTHEGLGIGLALVKQLTELQHGLVTIASAGTGAGTEVTIQFPRVMEADQAWRAIPSGKDPVLQTLAGRRVLLVEDTDDTRETTRLMLERFGADVVEARDGLEALALAAVAPFDVVLCDLRMPRMDGFEFIDALHDLCGRNCPPVIAISGLASRDDHLRTARAGFEAHLDKPFEDTGLLGAIGAVIARRHQH